MPLNITLYHHDKIRIYDEETDEIIAEFELVRYIGAKRAGLNIVAPKRYKIKRAPDNRQYALANERDKDTAEIQKLKEIFEKPIKD